MSPRTLRVEQALDLVPDLDDLLPLRDALIGASRGDERLAWTASEAYVTLDTRLADPDALEALIPELVEASARRLEGVYRRVAEALRLAQQGDEAAAAASLVAAGEVEEAASRLAAAEHFYRKAREIGRRPRDRRPEGLALRRLGRVARARGQLERSLRLYRQGFEVAEAQRDVEGMVVACQGLGNVHGDHGSWREAAAWYERGVALLSPGDPSRPLWQLQSNLSVAARRQGRLEASREWLHAARRTVDALDDDAGRVFLHNAEGLLRLAEGDPGGAEASYREALAAAATPAARATVLVNLAECLLARGQSAEAERSARELERIAVVHRLTPLLPHAYRALGAVARARRDREGFVFFEQALDLCLSLDASPLELAITQQEYGRFEAEIGEMDSAAARLREAEQIVSELGALPELARIGHDLAALEAQRARTTDATRSE